MIVFVGNRFKLGGLSEVIKTRLDDEITYIDESTNIFNQENDILHVSKDASYILYDTNQYYNDAEEIVGIIKRIYRTNKAKPILLVPTDNPKNEIVKNALSQQIKYFINAGMQLGEQKDQLEKILVGFYDANGREDIKAAAAEVKKEDETLKEFTQSLYDAKQREDKKEKTIIIKKKRNSEVALIAVKDILRILFSIVDIALVTIAIIVLIYPEPRAALFNTLNQILLEIKNMV